MPYETSDDFAILKIHTNYYSLKILRYYLGQDYIRLSHMIITFYLRKGHDNIQRYHYTLFRDIEKPIV